MRSGQAHGHTYILGEPYHIYVAFYELTVNRNLVQVRAGEWRSRDLTRMHTLFAYAVS